MKYILILLLATTACTKASQKPICHVCKFPGESQWHDAGCMTKDEWQTVKFTDVYGNYYLNKDQYCRLK
jgi:hypothetical protein